jgi:hypothetical protein
MPTYKLGPGTQWGLSPPMFRHPLICEVCLEPLGNVPSVTRHKGLSARLVVSMWPEMRDVVERHEALCLPSEVASW